MSEDGGPAFPQTSDSWYRRGGDSPPVPSGMSLRDWLAATIDIPWEAVASAFEENEGPPTIGQLLKTRATMRYMEADAMLAARTKPPWVPETSKT